MSNVDYFRSPCTTKLGNDEISSSCSDVVTNRSVIYFGNEKKPTYHYTLINACFVPRSNADQSFTVAPLNLKFEVTGTADQ